MSEQSWDTGSFNPNTEEEFPGRDPLIGWKFTRRGEIVIACLAILTMLALMAIVGKLE